MQAQYGIRQASAARTVQLALAVVVILFALAAGYAIRSVTGSAQVAVSHATVTTHAASSAAGASDTCVFVGGRKAC
jgi:hypothetical protein